MIQFRLHHTNRKQIDSFAYLLTFKKLEFSQELCI
jgi:hypothetical protein